jgi:hypothetical protein
MWSHHKSPWPPKQAIVKAVKAFPYEIKPKPSTPNKATISNAISVVVGTVTGKRFTIDNIASNAKASELVNMHPTASAASHFQQQAAVLRIRRQHR